MMMKAFRILLVGLAAFAVALVPAMAHGKKQQLQQRIALPNGFQPEGIASTGNKYLYVGSIPTGAIWRGSAKTGQGSILVPPHEGRSAIGIKVAHGLVFVAGGGTGDAYVYDARTGEDVARYDLAPEGAGTFVNDLVVTPKAVWFTDSRLQQVYKLPLGRKGKLPQQSAVSTLPLTGDIAYTETGPNANGIEWTGRSLIVVQSNSGKLFSVDPKTGVAREIDLGGENVVNGDGLLLRGRTLYVVQNRRNQIAVVRLSAKKLAGTVVRRLTDPDFDVPTTITISLGRLFAANARFGTPPGPDVPYWVARVG
jgi:sugar lactone lactonase YvrE